MDNEIRHMNQELIQFIRERREELGLTQAELAKRAGIGQPYVSKIEGGVIRSPSTSTINSLAKALEMDVDEFWNATLAIPNNGEVGYCPNLRCPGSNFNENSHLIIRHNTIDYSQWEPYKASIEDTEGPIEFCMHCGNKLLTECGNCGRKMKRFYRYCPGCGHYLLHPWAGTSEEENENETPTEPLDDDDVPF